MSKKIAFFTPYFKSNRGNATTTKRIVHGLNQAGIETFVVPYLEEKWTEEKEMKVLECDIYHILHLYRFAKWNMCRELPLSKPYILTSGGTDINHDLGNPAQLAEMDKMIHLASAITVFTKDGQEKVKAIYPEKEIRIIPQSVWFEDFDEPLSFTLPTKKPVLFLPAGIRSVKDPLYVWEAIKELKKKFTDLQFIIAGVVIEKDLHHQVMDICQQYNWVHFLEDIPFHQMNMLYKHADLTINTSISEGQPVAIMEAMYNFCPVLVRENEGNLSIVTHEKTGLVFSDSTSFFEMATKVLTDEELATKITLQAKNYIMQHHSLEKEIQQYIDLYNTYL
ncbi:glycosyltransferase family 4 protein [Bacillus sp. DJP31]|uniref:glycosyltransferase family 4 protein n=1 Tax=Bacillus sp. DJP31 TaxID=3409789 RepID=UPI003BB5706C